MCETRSLEQSADQDKSKQVIAQRQQFNLAIRAMTSAESFPSVPINQVAL